MSETGKPHPEEALAQRASNFADNFTTYLANGQEVREVKWLHLGLEASQQLQQRKREGLFTGSLGVF